jgi:hypothetical protein
MKPTEEKYQAATRVNAISPEIVVFEEADNIKASGRQYGYTHKWREYNHSSGVLGSGMVLNGLCRNLGDPDRFPMEYLQTSREGKNVEMSVRESDNFIVL